MPAAFPADSITNVARWRSGPEKLAATAISVKHMAASGPTGWKATIDTKGHELAHRFVKCPLRADFVENSPVEAE
jgi:hypothetical protein